MEGEESKRFEVMVDVCVQCLCISETDCGVCALLSAGEEEEREKRMGKNRTVYAKIHFFLHSSFCLLFNDHVVRCSPVCLPFGAGAAICPAEQLDDSRRGHAGPGEGPRLRPARARAQLYGGEFWREQCESQKYLVSLAPPLEGGAGRYSSTLTAILEPLPACTEGYQSPAWRVM